MSGSDETSLIRYARLAGFMYLFVDASDALSLFITGRFRVPGNAVETAHRIMGAEVLYRVGLSSFLLASLCTVFLAIGLYVTLKAVDDNLALTALVFRLVEATVFGVLVIFGFQALKLYTGADSIALPASLLNALVSSYSAASLVGFNVAALFFSVGSILFFYLFLKSRCIPRVLSVWGLAGSLLIPVIGFAILLWPQRKDVLQLGWIPLATAEVAVGFWLMFKGVNVRVP